MTPTTPFLRKFNLRDVLEGVPEVVPHLMYEVPLLLCDRGADVVRRHLCLVEEPLEDEQRGWPRN